jgi:hypothetical protein
LFCPKFFSQHPSSTTERQKLRPFVSKYPPRFPTLKTVFRSIRRRHIHTHNPCETLLLQSRNPISTNNLAPAAVVTMSVVLRQKLIFEPAKINIISHTTKQLRNFQQSAVSFWFWGLRKLSRRNNDRGNRGNRVREKLSRLNRKLTANRQKS